MSRVSELITAYRRHVEIPLRSSLPLSQRTWFLVYPPEDERKLRNQLPELEIATLDAGLTWNEINLTSTFASWFDEHDPDEEQRLEALAVPEDTEDYADPAFANFLAEHIAQKIANFSTADPSRTVHTITGVMELYDFVHISSVIDNLPKEISGILLLLFPGTRENNSYRFLGARDNWDYLATPITLDS